MAITELFKTRSTQESINGANMSRTFRMTFPEYDDDFDIFTGDLLGTSTLDDDFIVSDINMRVVNIRQVGVDNEKTTVEVFYSTENAPNIGAIADAANSWVETFDMSAQDKAVDTYIDAETGSAIDWEADWAANKPAGASSTAPELIISEGFMEFRLTTYGSTLYFQRILNSINRINGINFLNNYFSFPPQSEIDIDGGIDDFDQWLFAACPITRVGKNKWRYDFVFRFKGDLFGWNDVDGLEVVIYSNKDPVSGELFDFNSLFVGMDFDIDTDISIRTGR